MQTLLLDNQKIKESLDRIESPIDGRDRQPLMMLLFNSFAQKVVFQPYREVEERLLQQLSDFFGKAFQQWRERPLGEMVYVLFDARYEKVREGGLVIDEALLQAIGIDRQGRRHVLGLSVSRSEADVHWREFFSVWCSVGCVVCS